MWAVGAVLAWAGLTVYLEFGLAIPRSGGEKNYVERVYRIPKHLATCVYGVLFVALGNTAGNAVSFSQYLIRACQPHKYARLEDGQFQTAKPPEGLSKGLGILCITVVCLIHLVVPKFGGKYLMSGLAAMKVMLLLLVIGYVSAFHGMPLLC
jgi:amino acid transporter